MTTGNKHLSVETAATRAMTPGERMEYHLKQAKSIADTAEREGRELTAYEVDRANKHLAAHKSAKAELTNGRMAMSHNEMNGLVKSMRFGDTSARAGMAPRGGRTKAWAEAVAGKFKQRRDLLAKAESSGSSDGSSDSYMGGVGPERSGSALVGASFSVPTIATVGELPEQPSSLLELIQTTVVTSDQFEYVQQSLRINNAAVVPDGAEKPVSNYNLVACEDRVRVFAHLSDPFPKRYLDDYTFVLAVLQHQMADGLKVALEREIVNGTGPTPSVASEPGKVVLESTVAATEGGLPGILNTPGIRTQAFTSDVLTTLGTAHAAASTAGETPNALVIHPADLAKLNLMREGDATGAFMFNSGRSALQSILGDAHLIASIAVNPGTAILGDFAEAHLVARQDDTLDIDGSGELFSKNLVRCRCEGRYGFALTRPSAFTRVTLDSAPAA